jgi:hypothetical protein
VTSYVIARTLGDPTASTSHKSSFATQLPPKSDSKIAHAADSIGPPTVLAGPGPDPIDIPVAVLSPEDESPPSGISTKPSTTSASTVVAPGAGATSSRAFFVDGEEGSEDDGAARLAGVGVFSPVASMPGSPTVSRNNFFERDGEDDGGGGGGSGSSVASGTDESGSPFVVPRGVLLRNSGGSGFTIHHHHQHHQHHQGGREAETEQEHEHEHEHSRSASDGGAGAGGGGSTSGESSFAILDREESFEDAGVHIRRRVPGAPTDE